jgi:hypothetical protein
MEKTESLYTVVGMKISTVTMENYMEVPRKTKHRDNQKWQLGHTNSLGELHESGTLLRYWRHPWLR